jgi:hypothetical protein
MTRQLAEFTLSDVEGLKQCLPVDWSDPLDGRTEVDG